MSRKHKSAVKRSESIAPAPSVLRAQQMLAEAVQHHQAGRLADAEKLYRVILDADPQNTDALHLLGLISYQAGDFQCAEQLIRQAIAYRENTPSYHYNLGCVLKDAGKPDEAMTHYQTAIALKPDYVEAHLNMGNVFLRLGKSSDAVACYEQALAQRPDHVGVHHHLGNILVGLNRLDEAIVHLEKASSLSPGSDEILNALGMAHMTAGHHVQAFTSFRKAAKLQPSNGEYWGHMACALQPIHFHSIDAAILDDLQRLLDQPSVRPGMVARAILNALRCHPVIAPLLTLSGENDALSYAEKAERLSSVPLLLRIMNLSNVLDIAYEKMFTRLRRDFIMAVDAGDAPTQGLPFFAALAVQCFHNEYAFAETDDETHAVSRLQDKNRAFLDAGHDVPPFWLAALGSFRPLYLYAWANTLLERSWPEAMSTLVTRQLAEPLEERSLRSSMPRMTSMKDDVSQAVRDQYEENPYPRWIRAEIFPSPMAIKDLLQSIFPRQDFSDYTSPEHPEILVAGCGTGRHPVSLSSRISGAKILAIDLSLSSLAYAKRKTRELGIGDIEYAQADILELGSLDRTFDTIESVGVLHHLRDPLAGWRVLVRLLKHGGFMKIALYSELARRSIVAAREEIAAQGYTSTAEDIRRFRQHVMTHPAGSALETLVHFADFYNLSECRDLLFHVQEHRFTIPQIAAALRALGLTFIGFELPGFETGETFRQRFPNPHDFYSLDCWHAFEQDHPDTFNRMYQFWCRKI